MSHHTLSALLLSSTDIEGGAARAAYRLHQTLRAHGVNSQILAQNKYSDDETVLTPTVSAPALRQAARKHLGDLPLKLYPRRNKGLYHLQWLPDHLKSEIDRINPDVVNLHWTCDNFMNLESPGKLQRPIVWTLHDMWPFTGGCHYSGECRRFEQHCGMCPLLGSNSDRDITHWAQQRKQRAYQQAQMAIVTPSAWLASEASCSTLFRDREIRVIPNSLDTSCYRPYDRRMAREILGLPQDKKLLAFGAISATQDQRKGFHLLQPALQELGARGWRERAMLVVFGASQPFSPPDMGLPTHYTGRLHDDITLSLLYSAADVFLSPSMQDNLPNTVMEALACGTPCAAFDIGGLPDLIAHRQRGYLASPFDPADFAAGVEWILADPSRHRELCENARAHALREYAPAIQAERYRALFEEIIASFMRSDAKID